MRAGGPRIPVVSGRGVMRQSGGVRCEVSSRRQQKCIKQGGSRAAYTLTMRRADNAFPRRLPEAHGEDLQR
jgi:hypothetical protein